MTKAKSESDGTDTITPPDEGDTTAPVADDRPSAEEYSTQGKTQVATRPGYAYNSADKSLPTITATGVKVTADQAQALVEESDGRVTVVKEED